MIFQDREKKRRESDNLLKRRIEKIHPSDPPQKIQEILKRVKEITEEIQR